MAWTRIDDKFLMNPKIQSAGVYGMALYLSGLIYCNTNLTDGYIAESLLPVLYGMAYQVNGKKVVNALVELNLWERVEGGYRIHDFLEFNKSRTEIESANDTRRSNGLTGGRPKTNLNKTETITETTPGQVIKSNLNETETITESEPISPYPYPYPNTNTQKDKTAAAALSEKSALVALYENCIGVATPVILDKIAQAETEYSAAWVEDALREAQVKQGRSWRYVEAILERWKREGRNNKKTATKQAGSYEAWKTITNPQS